MYEIGKRDGAGLKGVLYYDGGIAKIERFAI